MTMTYGELKQAIQDYVEYSETTFVNNVPLFIRLAEERILKQIQLSLFRKNATASLFVNDEFLKVPSDFLSPFSLSIEGADGEKHFLLFKDPSFIQMYTPDDAITGTPKYYSQFDVNNFILAPTPDEAYTAELHYFYRPSSITTLSDSGTTWLSENAEMALFYGALLEANIFIKGEDTTTKMYTTRLQESIAGIKRMGESLEIGDEYRRGKIVGPRQ